jgi:hypothetical protein
MRCLRDVPFCDGEHGSGEAAKRARASREPMESTNLKA